MKVLRLVENMFENSLDDERISFLQYFNNQSLLNKKGLLVRVHNANFVGITRSLKTLNP
jgi:hypothetical protein